MWQLIEVGDTPRLCPATMDRESILTIVYEGDTPFAAVADFATAHLVKTAPQLLELVREYRRAVEYYALVDEAKGDDEGANLKMMTISRIDDVLRETGALAPVEMVLPTMAPPPVVDFMIEVAAEIERAALLHPGPNPNLAALTEEVGEVSKALLEGRARCLELGALDQDDWSDIRAEAVQVATMAFRIAFEGDPTLDVVPE